MIILTKMNYWFNFLIIDRIKISKQTINKNIMIYINNEAKSIDNMSHT